MFAKNKEKGDFDQRLVTLELGVGFTQMLVFGARTKRKSKFIIFFNFFQYGSGSRRLRGEGSSAQRRAQSEGPGIRNPLFRDDGNDIRPATYVTRGGSNPVRATENVPVHSRRERSAPNKEAQVQSRLWTEFLVYN